MKTDTKSTRLLFLDNLKLLFVLLVIFQHAASTYGVMGGFWYYKIETDEFLNENLPTDPFSPVIVLNLTLIGILFNASLMGLFFLMGGFFTPGSYDRKGVPTYWKERLIRLGIPLALYIAIVDPIMIYSLAELGIEPWSTYSFYLGWDSFVNFYLSRFKSVEGIIGFEGFIGFLTSAGPMWFLQVLLILTAGYTLWRQFTKTDLLKKYMRDEYEIPSYLKLLMLGFILGILTFFVRLYFPVGRMEPPIFHSGLSIAFSIQYIMMFSVGVISFRSDWFQKVSNTQIKQWIFTIFVVIIIFIIYIFSTLGIAIEQFSEFRGGFTLSSFVYSVVDNIICVGMIFVLIPIFRKKLDYQGNLTRKLSNNAYHMFLVHAPILVIVSLSLAFLQIAPLAKLALVYPLTVLLCFLFSQYVLRRIL